ncbi:hypothetical protein EX30DRAFT_399077 [Ascodesmis nigricans]|uniref:Uncharacterized protein n=1 Tax=Ascodesmis nigricans TaxID=341454 RepID=A0A4S2MJ12_9PEZI|nr:hypothetical protein EX30DRAFT_399077 [Ascodesmis nigricans]
MTNDPTMQPFAAQDSESTLELKRHRFMKRLRQLRQNEGETLSNYLGKTMYIWDNLTAPRNETDFDPYLNETLVRCLVGGIRSQAHIALVMGILDLSFPGAQWYHQVFDTVSLVIHLICQASNRLNVDLDKPGSDDPDDPEVQDALKEVTAYTRLLVHKFFVETPEGEESVGSEGHPQGDDVVMEDISHQQSLQDNNPLCLRVCGKDEHHSCNPRSDKARDMLDVETVLTRDGREMLEMIIGIVKKQDDDEDLFF